MSILSRLRNTRAALLGEPAPTPHHDEIVFLRSAVTRYKLHLEDLDTIRRTLTLMGEPASPWNAAEATRLDALLSAEDRARFVAVAAQWRSSGFSVPDESAEAHDPRECRGCSGDLAGLIDAVCGQCRKDLADVFAPEEKPPTKPAPKVPEARVLAILRGFDRAVGVMAVPQPLTARAIAFEVAISDGDGPFSGLSISSIARIISDVAALGYLQSDGKRPLRYTITDTGRAARP